MSKVFNTCVIMTYIPDASEIAGTALCIITRTRNYFRLENLDDLGGMISRAVEISSINACSRARTWSTMPISHPSTIFLDTHLT